MTTDARVAQLEKKLAEDKDYREMRDYAKKLEKLAYLGEHHFPDLTYKARLAESRREVEGLRAALREARGMMKILDRHAEYEAVTEFLNRTDALVTQLPTAPQKDKP